MSNYAFEKMNPNQFHLLIPLMQNCFGMDVDVNYFKWKYCDNPAGELIAWVAKNEHNEIVGFEGSIPERYYINNELKILYQSVDSMTHSEHRKKGIFKKLSFACYDEMKQNNNFFILGFGGVDSILPLIKFGWKTIFDIYYYFRIPVQARLKMSGYSKTQGFDIRRVENLNEIIPVNEINYKNYPIRKSFDETILKWKLSNPRYRFEITGIYKDRVLIGYFIYYLLNNKIMLYDAAFCENNHKAEIVLFSWLDSLMLKNKYQGILSISQKNIYYSNLLVRNGFLRNVLPFGPLKDSIPYMIITNYNDLEFYSDSHNWAVVPYGHDSF
jgi:hypothetical protein